MKEEEEEEEEGEGRGRGRKRKGGRRSVKSVYDEQHYSTLLTNL